MRVLLLSLGLAAFGSSAWAQPSAEVTVNAQVRIPDFLNVQVGEISETILDDGQHVRRVTLHITANRAWTLTVVRTSTSGCTAEVTVSASSGKRGRHSVVVEFTWDRDEAAPASNDFEYVLAGT